ncbi:MAG: hypothetical protein F6J90_01965 [Moorea sp. SIOASIH]|uniref:hypothetical protein n=1 Tax=Moorena sp. SIOASIH TaxID=2607817 RepID=UPI0013B699F1|nr:hypothetical protein [Moorena sp. SIOASIH]NEO35135.1 hypothetical protein [Moorena sp. SIOASIH]
MSGGQCTRGIPVLAMALLGTAHPTINLLTTPDSRLPTPDPPLDYRYSTKLEISPVPDPQSRQMLDYGDYNSYI